MGSLERTAAAVTFLALMGAAGEAMATETPKYKVVAKVDAFEVRDYEAYLVAETEVAGDRDSAGDAGFRILADYIFGNNRGARKIAMTAPVTQVEAGTKIAMTAPVAQVATAAGRFIIQSKMPTECARAYLPAPVDERVRFRQVPAGRVAALRYSGTWSESRYLDHLAKLRASMARDNLEPAGEPVWARYDPPFKPWFLRTNEILVEVRQ
jgi:hypothetical protein